MAPPEVGPAGPHTLHMGAPKGGSAETETGPSRSNLQIQAPRPRDLALIRDVAAPLP